MQETTNEPNIGVRFREAFNMSEQAYHPDTDGDGDGDFWAYRSSAVGLLGPETSEFGACDTSVTFDAQYNRTETHNPNGGEKRRCYVFDTPFGETWVNVEFVRTLANDVFDVSYDKMRRGAVCLDPNDVYADEYDGPAPLLFTFDNYTAFVCPIFCDE